MRRIIFQVSVTGIVALITLGAHLSERLASAGQGKGGEVIAKPTPTPKKTTPPKNRSTPAKSSKSSSDTGSNTLSEIAFWETIKTSADPEDFKAYLKKYPNGQFVDLARNRLNALETAAKEAAARKEEARLAEEEAKKAEAKRKELEALKRPGAVVKNSIGMELVYVPPGSFMMGSNNGQSDEKPVHRVTIGEGFFIGRYEVTQIEWQQVMGNRPSSFRGDNLPVETVTWPDAQSFINKLNERRGGLKYRLPTEAEWEYACRAGTTTDFAFGNSLSSDQANFDGNYPYGEAAKGAYRQKTTAVGSFAPNAFGLYDMHGNVWEWCEDWYHETYTGAPTDGSAWLSGGEQKYRAMRGGSWYNDHGSFLRSAHRGYNTAPDSRFGNFGFRLVAVVWTQ
jgi:formylglycine-generating enzyme required for sulfatase activity